MKVQEKFRNEEIRKASYAMPSANYIPDSALIAADVIKENHIHEYDDKLSPGFIY